MTFDGVYYNFQENCSYTLVKEINFKYNLTIIVDNHYCGNADNGFCPQSLIIHYNSYEVILTQQRSGETTENMVTISKISFSLLVFFYAPAFYAAALSCIIKIP